MACSTSWLNPSGCTNEADQCLGLCDGMTTTELHALGEPDASCDGMFLLTTGLAADADGGGGMWVYDGAVARSTANLGTVVDPSVAFTLAAQGSGSGTGCWMREYSGAINAAWFGFSSSSTDNSDAWQAAINAAMESQSYAVSIPNGKFQSAAVVTWPKTNNDGDRYKGLMFGVGGGLYFGGKDGDAAPTEAFAASQIVHTGTGDLLHLDSGSVELRDLSFVGDQNTGSAIGITNGNGEGGNAANLVGCSVEGFTTGLWYQYNAPDPAFITRCVVSKCGIGVHIGSKGNSIDFSHCTMKYNTVGIQVGDRYNPDGKPVICVIRDSIIERSLDVNLDIIEATLLTIEGNYFESGRYSGDSAKSIRFGNYGNGEAEVITRNVTIRGNYFNGLFSYNGSSESLITFKQTVASVQNLKIEDNSYTSVSPTAYFIDTTGLDATSTLIVKNNTAIDLSSTLTNDEDFFFVLVDGDTSETGRTVIRRDLTANKGYFGNAYVDSAVQIGFGEINPLLELIHNDTDTVRFQGRAGAALEIKQNGTFAVGMDGSGNWVPGADDTYNLGGSNRWAAVQANRYNLSGGATGVNITAGTGTPEGAVQAGIGSLYLRTDGGANTTLYIKESGVGTAGWVAK